MPDAPYPPNKRRKATARSPRVNLDITAELIEQSIQRDSSHCMIAEAVKAAVPGARSVSVDLQTIRFSDPDPKRPYRYTYLTPRVGQVALVDFDRGAPIEPFTMRLQGAAVTSRGNPKERDRKQAQRARLVKERVSLAPNTKNPETAVPDRIGGRTPPLAALSAGRGTPPGRRRAYGVRGLDR